MPSTLTLSSLTHWHHGTPQSTTQAVGTPGACTASTISSSPQLPIEVWEQIIDLIAEDHVLRRALLVCCLTCRSWVSRCRYHLFPNLVLRSSDHLSYASSVLAASPTLCERVGVLRVYGGKDSCAEDQSWISLVPIQLASKLGSLERLAFTYVDLSRLNNHFYQFCTLFQPAKSLELFYNQWNQFSQVSRLTSAVRARELRLDNDTHLGGFAVGHTSQLASRSVRLPGIMKLALPLEALGRVPFASFGSPLSIITIRTSSADVDDPLSWNTLLQVVRNLGTLFAKLCSIISREQARIHLLCGDWCRLFIIAGWDPTLQRHRRHLNIYGDPEPDNRARLGPYAQMMLCFENIRFDNIKLSFNSSNVRRPEPSPETRKAIIQSLKTEWSFVDEALSMPQFLGLSRIEIWFPKYEDLFPRQPTCVVPRVKKFLPGLASRDFGILCNPNASCQYHHRRRRGDRD